MFESPDEFFDDLILQGAVEVAGIDPETGDFLYSFTEKIHEVAPEIAKKSEEFFNSAIYYLWELGFINMDITSNSPTVSLNEKALDQQEVSKLDPELRMILRTIIDALRLE